MDVLGSNSVRTPETNKSSRYCLSGLASHLHNECKEPSEAYHKEAKGLKAANTTSSLSEARQVT